MRMDSAQQALFIEEAATAVEREIRRRLGGLERENDRLRGEVRQARLELDRYVRRLQIKEPV